jgi:hypothetical protein
MPEFHPAFRSPSHEFHIVRGHVFRPHDRCRPVILLELFINDQISFTEIFRHRSSRIRRRMLNVRPIHIAPREFEIGFNGFLCVVGIANDQATHHVHPVLMDVINGFDGGIAPLTTFPLCVFAVSPRKSSVPPESQPKTPTAASRNPRNGAAILAAPRLILLCSRVATVTLGVLGIMGAMLSITGIFGMAAYSVSKRMKELGIRVALFKEAWNSGAPVLVSPSSPWQKCVRLPCTHFQNSASDANN